MREQDIAKAVRDRKRREEEEEDERKRKRNDWLNPSNLTDPANPLSWVVFY